MMRATLCVLLAAISCSTALAQQPTATQPCTCEPDLIPLTEHTDVRDRNYTETADTAITYLRSLIGTAGLPERQKTNSDQIDRARARTGDASVQMLQDFHRSGLR